MGKRPPWGAGGGGISEGDAQNKLIKAYAVQPGTATSLLVDETHPSTTTAMCWEGGFELCNKGMPGGITGAQLRTA